tara:strand:+ start:338 stop:715 length:378 start_codon:yes stop_codon:yes gene_type:complete
MNEHYSIKAPLSTHWREATCEEVDCRKNIMGWETHCNISTQLGRDQVAYIRAGKSGRRYTERKDVEEIVIFSFGPGQQCFTSHTKKIEEKGHLLLREAGGQRQVISEPERWMWEFNESMERGNRM